MADLIWNWKNKDYKATPITIGDWELLGNYLKGYLLNDLKYIDDFELRLQTQSLIQMRDYDLDDVRRHWARKDMRHRATLTIFKNEPKVNDALITEFETDDTFYKFIREVLKVSGIKFIDEVSESEKSENPTENEDLAESA